MLSVDEISDVVMFPHDRQTLKLGEGMSDPTDAAALGGEIQALYSERERAYERLALAAHERGDATTREQAARLEGELAGIRRVAMLLGFELSAREVAFRPR
jgi:hypothetical protein